MGWRPQPDSQGRRHPIGRVENAELAGAVLSEQQVLLDTERTCAMSARRWSPITESRVPLDPEVHGCAAQADPHSGLYASSLFKKLVLYGRRLRRPDDVIAF